MAHVHAGIVQDQVADIDEVTVEDERPDGLGHVAAGLPAGRKIGGLQAGIEAHHADGDLLKATGDALPRQLRQDIGARHQERLIIKVPCPAAESHAWTLKLSC